MRTRCKPLLLALTFLVLASMLIVTPAFPAFADESDGEQTTPGGNYVVAHWKFRNDPKYVSGNIDEDNLTFKDITGNGNDLVVAYEGNGDQLDIFSWDIGVDPSTLSSTDKATSLKFDNTLVKAQSVDPYDASETSYSGAYVSGKYLETVSGAPINNFSTPTGWTVEIIFKVSPEFNNNYNRYCGLFSRQGVVESQNEPAFSMALTEFSNGEADGSLGENGRTGYQYLHVDENENKTNYELENGTLAADVWHHFMVTSDGEMTDIYVDGEYICTCEEENKIYISDPLFSWEVGVGRKLKGTNATMNPEHPEGLIRRLFCGSISEIRFSEDYMEIEDSLLYTSVLNEEETKSDSTKPKLEHDNIIDNWDPDVFGTIFKNDGNQVAASLCNEGLKIEWTGDENTSPDPFYIFNISGYYKKTDSTAPKMEGANYVVIKFKSEGCDGLFQLFTQAPNEANSETVEYTPEDMHEDGWYYLMFDMSLTDLVEQKKLTTIRMDWSGGNTAVGAYCIIGAVGFFEEEKDACEWCGIEYVTQGPRATKAPATAAPTEAPTEAPEAPTEVEKSGCGSVVVSGAVLLLTAAAAAVALKRR